MADTRAFTDDDLASLVDPRLAVDAMERAFAERATGTLEAPPRWSIDANDGSLVFTAGAATGPTNAVGFRAYETYPGRTDDHRQLVAVFDATTGAFDGLFVGHGVGRWRTGAIGGVAVDALARRDASVLGVLGSGPQAETQLAAACAVRDFDRVAVYSPTADHREAFADAAADAVDPPVDPIADPEPVVSDADVLVCATNATDPVFDADWLAPGAHVTTIGPKFEGAHELPLEVVNRSAVVATDSLAQVDGYDRPFVVSGNGRDRMVELADVLAGDTPGRTSDEQVTLFCSVGLAGTEVILGKALLERANARDD